MKYHLLCLLLCLIGFQISAQDELKIFEWSSHLPKKIAKNVTQSKNHVFYHTENNIIKISKEEYATSYFSKVDGLSDVGISTIAYNESNDLLIIAYKSGNIDLLKEDGTILNIPDLAINQILIGRKDINSIYTKGDFALLACAFGVLEINLKTLNSGFTCNMNLVVNDIIVVNEVIYAATNEGVYTFDQKTNQNPGFFGQWGFLGADANFPQIYKATDLELFSFKLFVVVDQSSVFMVENASAQKIIQVEEPRQIVLLTSSPTSLIIGDNDTPDSRLMTVDQNLDQTEWVKACAFAMTSAIIDQYGTIWYCDNWHRIKYQDGVNGDCHAFDFDSPYDEACVEVRIKNSDIYVASGGINENYLFDAKRDGFYIRQNNTWTNINENSVPIIRQKGMFNFVVAQPHPSKNIVYGGAFPGGILEYNIDTKEAEVFNHNNSPITGPPDNDDSERVADIYFDKNENMWASVFLSNRPLVVRTAEGQWESFSFGNNVNLADIIEDDFGKLWIQLGGPSGGVIVFDYNQTISDKSDDKWVLLSQSNAGLKSNRVLSLDIDLDGNTWIGTDLGPAIYDAGNPLDQVYRVTYKVVQEDSIPAILLETESINSIVIDGGDRKWFGTSNGIFVQTANAENQIHRYTTTNSPLFSDNVLDLAFDPVTGIMYISTAEGLQSIRTESTGATDKINESELYVFPNPVRPDYSGPIAINGLATNCNAKITDVAGNLVYEMESVGGTAIWNGVDLSGNQVVSGVYQVFASSTTNFEIKDTETCKFVIIR